MTVVAVRKTKKGIDISADRQTTFGSNKYSDKKEDIFKNPSKLFQENGMTIGCSGAVWESNLMKVYSKSHKPKTATEDDVLDFIVEFQDFVQKKKGKAGFEYGNHYIIVFGGKIFRCMGIDVAEINEYTAVGSGMFLALSALYFGKSTIEAIEVAKEFDLYCGGETNTISIDKK